MALTAPTPPTPPVPPVVPGGRQDSGAGESGFGQNPVNGTDSGRSFGVHITISNPQQDGSQEKGTAGNTAGDAVQGVSDGQSGRQAVQAGSGRQKQADDAGDAAVAQDIARQARQDVVQRMLGEDGTGGEAQAETAVRTDAPWPLPGSNPSLMSFLPLLIVFVAAFITFTLRGMSKKQAAFQGAGRKKKAPQAGTATSQVEARTGLPDKSGNEEKSKGRHFEMRI
ncbi:hypothetical protein [Anaerovibrio sp.]|uniref:hypothetical protein n=1 Tax=Anaerovibrio sp. TaxID=1872532 RepID=UPI003F166D34